MIGSSFGRLAAVVLGVAGAVWAGWAAGQAPAPVAPPSVAVPAQGPPVVVAAPVSPASIPHDFARWEKEIAGIEAVDGERKPARGGIVFTGSSVIRLWKTLAEDFPHHKVVNHGFGGSEIADATHFADRLIFPLEPRQVVLRAGGNDLHNGRLPEEVAADFAEFVRVVHARLPTCEITYLAFNPAPARWGETDKIRELNRQIRAMALRMPRVGFIDAFDVPLDAAGNPRRELFVADLLHYNADGYKLLAERVRPFLMPAH